MLEEAARREMDPIIYVLPKALFIRLRETVHAYGPLSDEPIGVYAQSKLKVNVMPANYKIWVIPSLLFGHLES